MVNTYWMNHYVILHFFVKILSTNALLVLITVTLMQCVLTVLGALPVPVTLDTVEMASAVQVRKITCMCL